MKHVPRSDPEVRIPTSNASKLEVEEDFFESFTEEDSFMHESSLCKVYGSKTMQTCRILGDMSILKYSIEQFVEDPNDWEQIIYQLNTLTDATNVLNSEHPSKWKLGSAKQRSFDEDVNLKIIDLPTMDMEDEGTSTYSFKFVSDANAELKDCKIPTHFKADGIEQCSKSDKNESRSDFRSLLLLGTDIDNNTKLNKPHSTCFCENGGRFEEAVNRKPPRIVHSFCSRPMENKDVKQSRLLWSQVEFGINARQKSVIDCRRPSRIVHGFANLKGTAISKFSTSSTQANIPNFNRKPPEFIKKFTSKLLNYECQSLQLLSFFRYFNNKGDETFDACNVSQPIEVADNRNPPGIIQNFTSTYSESILERESSIQSKTDVNKDANKISTFYRELPRIVEQFISRLPKKEEVIDDMVSNGIFDFHPTTVGMDISRYPPRIIKIMMSKSSENSTRVGEVNNLKTVSGTSMFNRKLPMLVRKIVPRPSNTVFEKNEGVETAPFLGDTSKLATGNLPFQLQPSVNHNPLEIIREFRSETFYRSSEDTFSPGDAKLVTNSIGNRIFPRIVQTFMFNPIKCRLSKVESNMEDFETIVDYIFDFGDCNTSKQLNGSCSRSLPRIIQCYRFKQSERNLEDFKFFEQLNSKAGHTIDDIFISVRNIPKIVQTFISRPLDGKAEITRMQHHNHMVCDASRNVDVCTRELQLSYKQLESRKLPVLIEIFKSTENTFQSTVNWDEIGRSKIEEQEDGYNELCNVLQVFEQTMMELGTQSHNSAWISSSIMSPTQSRNEEEDNIRPAPPDKPSIYNGSGVDIGNEDLMQLKSNKQYEPFKSNEPSTFVSNRNKVLSQFKRRFKPFRADYSNRNQLLFKNEVNANPKLHDKPYRYDDYQEHKQAEAEFESVLSFKPFRFGGSSTNSQSDAEEEINSKLDVKPFRYDNSPLSMEAYVESETDSYLKAFRFDDSPTFKEEEHSRTDEKEMHSKLVSKPFRYDDFQISMEEGELRTVEEEMNSKPVFKPFRYDDSPTSLEKETLKRVEEEMNSKPVFKPFKFNDLLILIDNEVKAESNTPFKFDDSSIPTSKDYLEQHKKQIRLDQPTKPFRVHDSQTQSEADIGLNLKNNRFQFDDLSSSDEDALTSPHVTQLDSKPVSSFYKVNVFSLSNQNEVVYQNEIRPEIQEQDAAVLLKGLSINKTFRYDNHTGFSHNRDAIQKKFKNKSNKFYSQGSTQKAGKSLNICVGDILCARRKSIEPLIF